jgi:hypothetical protein
MTLAWEGHLGTQSCDTIKPWPFLRRCAYSSTGPNKLNFTIELPRRSNARLDTRQCRISEDSRAAQKRSLRGGAVSLETSNVGRRAWVCEMIHEKASCSSTGKRNKAVGEQKKWLWAKRGAKKRASDLHFFLLATCQLLVSIDALGAGSTTNSWCALRKISRVKVETLFCRKIRSPCAEIYGAAWDCR